MFLLLITAVAECMWEDRQPTCRVEKGYLFNNQVSSHVSIWIPEATEDPADSYSCWHTGSNSKLLDTCSLYVSDTGRRLTHTYLFGTILYICTYTCSHIILISLILMFKFTLIAIIWICERKGSRPFFGNWINTGSAAFGCITNSRNHHVCEI